MQDTTPPTKTQAPVTRPVYVTDAGYVVDQTERSVLWAMRDAALHGCPVMYRAERLVGHVKLYFRPERPGDV